MRRMNLTQLLGIVCTTGLLLLGSERPCFGWDLLAFQFDPNGPLIVGSGGSLNYNASTGEFSGTSVPLTLSSPLLPGGVGSAPFASDSLLSFDLFVNTDGTFRSDPDGFNLNGNLTIDATETNSLNALISGGFLTFKLGVLGEPTILVINSLVTPDDGFLTRQETLADGTPLPPLFPIGRPIGIEFLVDNLTSGTPGDFTQS